MSITINIELPDFDAAGLPVDKTALLAQHLDALGFVRKLNPFGLPGAPANDNGPASTSEIPSIHREPLECWSNESAKDAPAAPEPTEEAPKRKRRTKAEMEAARAAETTPQISTGEARVGPEDDPEVAAQDAADEAAEVEAHRDPQNPLTLDDLRKAVGELTKKIGFAQSVKVVPQILGCAVTEVPETQEALTAAIAKVNEHMAGAAPAAPPEPAAPAATHADVQTAIEAYAAAYGNEATLQDRLTINEAVLGPVPAGLKNANGAVVNYWPVSAMPADKLAEVVAAWRQATETNPVGRALLNG